MSELLPAGHPFAGLRRNFYRCFLIDPPTDFSAGKKTRPQHYARMSDHAIAALPVLDLVHPDGAWLFLWATSPKLYVAGRSRTKLRPDELVKPWGFRYSARAFVWVKLLKRLEGRPELFLYPDQLHHGLGLTTNKNAEDCLLFRRGRPKRRRGVKEIIVAPRQEHSRKPAETHRRIEAYCDGPYVELFAREPRAGWDVWGNETTKFVQPLIEGRAA